MTKTAAERTQKVRDGRNKVAQRLGVPSWAQLGTRARDGEFIVIPAPADLQALADRIRDEFPEQAGAIDRLTTVT